MNATTKKIASFSFILLGFVPLLFVLIITIEKHEIRQRMKKQLQRQDLQTIILPENEVVWMDKHEIWVNDHMFDIHSRKLEKGVYTFTGLYDEDETILVKKERDITGESNEENKLLSQLFKCIHTIFYTSSSPNDNLVFTFYTNTSFMEDGPVTQFMKILTPPPQVTG